MNRTAPRAPGTSGTAADRGPAAPGRRPSLLPILAVSFIGNLGYSIVLPFLVFLVVRLGGNAVVYGVVGATYSAFQLLGAPVMGRWSDRVGRKKVLLVSQLGTFVAWGIFLAALALPVSALATVDSPWLGRFTLTVPLLVLFASRALDGLTGGNVSVANAYLADVTEEADRARSFGRMSIAANLGFVLGPAIAGLLGAAAPGEWLPVLAAFAISAVATVVVWRTLEEPEPCVLTAPPEPVTVNDVLGGDRKECYRLAGEEAVPTSRLLALPPVRLLLTLQALVFLAFNFYYVGFPVHAATALAWSVGEVGVYFTVMSLLMALVQGPVLARLTRRFAEKPLVVGGSVALAAGFALFASPSTPVIYAGTALVALGNGVMWPSLMALLAGSTRPGLQGAVQGLAGSVNALASIAGLLIGGGLYQSLGGATFLLSAAVTVLVAAAALRLGAARSG